MSIVFRFTSGSKPALFAFAGDRPGSSLPDKYGPWIADGIIRPTEAMPHKLDRETVEQAIKTQGYQLWRMKVAPTSQR
jgi:hypothetical protein